MLHRPPAAKTSKVQQWSVMGRFAEVHCNVAVVVVKLIMVKPPGGTHCADNCCWETWKAIIRASQIAWIGLFIGWFRLQRSFG